jgi:hypothetical protein
MIILEHQVSVELTLNGFADRRVPVSPLMLYRLGYRTLIFQSLGHDLVSFVFVSGNIIHG